jgi:hypothetical protein
MKAVFDALNVAGAEKEKRGFIKLNLFSSRENDLRRGIASVESYSAEMIA